MKTGALFEKVEKIKMPIRIAIFLGTFVLLAGLFIWLIYIPKTEEIATTREEIAKLQQKLNQAMVRARALKKFEVEYAEVDAQFQEALKPSSQHQGNPQSPEIDHPTRHGFPAGIPPFQPSEREGAGLFHGNTRLH